MKKSSTAVECQEIFEKLTETNSIPMPGNCSAATRRIELQRLKKAGKSIVAEKYKERASEKSNQMEVQGALVSLLLEEKTNKDWQSLIYLFHEGLWLLQLDPQQIA